MLKLHVLHYIVSFGYSCSQLLPLPSFAPNPYFIDPASSFLERGGYS